MNHQIKQKEVIAEIKNQISRKDLRFSTVSAVENFENDPRLCLTSVHFPKEYLIDKISQEIINPLKESFPEHYYYSTESFHMTVKGIRVINDPPHFTEEDVEKAKKIFSAVVPNHRRYNVHFYKLLFFPSNLALVGTTDPELDSLVLDLDDALRKDGIPDDKIYVNSRYFFANITLARFNREPSQKFKDKVKTLAGSIKWDTYVVDSVTLLTSNAVLNKLSIKGTWNLK